MGRGEIHKDLWAGWLDKSRGMSRWPVVSGIRGGGESLPCVLLTVTVVWCFMDLVDKLWNSSLIHVPGCRELSEPINMDIECLIASKEPFPAQHVFFCFFFLPRRKNPTY